MVNTVAATKVKRRTSRGPVLSTERTALRGRRTAIIDSMLRFLLRKKVATGSLNDLPKAAGMSVSHLLYYFPNKEAVEQQLVATIIEQMNNEMNAYRFAPPQKRMLPADYFFGGRSIHPRIDPWCWSRWLLRCIAPSFVRDRRRPPAACKLIFETCFAARRWLLQWMSGGRHHSWIAMDGALYHLLLL